MRILALITALVLGSPLTARALPEPPAPPPSNPVLRLRIDLHRVLDSDASGAEAARLPSDAAVITGVNEIWQQCSIRFELRNSERHRADRLGVPYEPRSMDELSAIAEAVAPKGWTGAIPLTFAGNWKVRRSNGSWLNGLGWAFVFPQAVDRLGAMVNTSALDGKRGIAIIAHEIAHALTLPHVDERDNLMGADGTPRLKPAQCAQARTFAARYLAAPEVAGL